MRKILILLMVMMFFVTGCSNKAAPSLNDENINPIEAKPAESSVINQEDQNQQEISEEENIDVNDTSLKEKMALIDFEEVSGYYTRKAIEEETEAEYVEMFSFEKNTFIRITTTELDREVFAYNYLSDDFTYIYYFDGEMTAKTKINVETGAVIEDSGDYAELLTVTADEIKLYFGDLMEVAGLDPDDLH